jgi:exodeoxyribonuclease VII small subunit
MATFEDRLTALESVVERLERGELTLDDSVKLFEQGLALSELCKAELEKAEGRIQMLMQRPGGGGMEAVDMELGADDPDQEPGELDSEG